MLSDAAESNRTRRRGFWLIGLLAGIPVLVLAAAAGLSFLFSEFGSPSVEAKEAGTIVLSADEPVAVRRIVLEANFPVPVREGLEPDLNLSVVLPRWVPQPDIVEKVRHVVVRESDGQVLGADHGFFEDLKCPGPPCAASYLVVFRLMDDAVPSNEFDWRASANLFFSSSSDPEETSLQMAVEEVSVDQARLYSVGEAEEFSLNPSDPLQARHVVVRLKSDVTPEEGFNHWPVFADLDDEPVTLNSNPDNSWFRPVIRRFQDADVSGVSPWSICQTGMPCEFGYTALIYFNDGPSHIDSSVESNPDSLQVGWRPGVILDFLDRIGSPPSDSTEVVVDHATRPGGFLTHRVAGQVELGQQAGIQSRTIQVELGIPEVSPTDLPVPIGALITARAHRADGSSRTPPFILDVGGDVMNFGGGRVISDGVTAYTMAIPRTRCLPGNSCTLTFQVNTRKDQPGDPDLIVDWSLDLHIGFYDTGTSPEGVDIESRITETVEP